MTALAPAAHTVLLAIHATAGSVGLLLGPVVIVRESRRLRAGARQAAGRSSSAYDTAVLVVCLSAVALVAMARPELWWLIPVSGLSYSLVLLARWAPKHRRRGWLHAYTHGRGGSYISLVTAFIVVALTVDGPLTGPAALIPWLAPTLIGTVLIERWRRRLNTAQQRQIPFDTETTGYRPWGPVEIEELPAV
ncbi:MAG: hypothetical protein H0V92_10560 [Pseudonocardiales bacterium]|nr:hypothetical protein [Pseudonocardiales bacterium]